LLVSRLALVMELPSELGAALESEPETATEWVFVKAATLQSAVLQPASGFAAEASASVPTMEREFRSIPAPTSRRLSLHLRSLLVTAYCPVL